jgi:hypothetical protein
MGDDDHHRLSSGSMEEMDESDMTPIIQIHGCRGF